ncbi:MAG: hypothetical protein QOF17_1218 [Solirubrobacteraceae bacterium]|nr:hypothetical protein [Solirubrobacteraceae bacterium]
MKLHGFKVRLLQIVDKYESSNAVYQSEGHPILIVFCCFRILQQSLQSIKQCHVQNISFGSLSLLNHNMYAASVREEGGFGLTKAIFNIE